MSVVVIMVLYTPKVVGLSKILSDCLCTNNDRGRYLLLLFADPGPRSLLPGGNRELRELSLGDVGARPP
jgi:hypothetical protein